MAAENQVNQPLGHQRESINTAAGGKIDTFLALLSLASLPLRIFLARCPPQWLLGQSPQPQEPLLENGGGKQLTASVYPNELNLCPCQVSEKRWAALALALGSAQEILSPEVRIAGLLKLSDPKTLESSFFLLEHTGLLHCVGRWEAGRTKADSSDLARAVR